MFMLFVYTGYINMTDLDLELMSEILSKIIINILRFSWLIFNRRIKNINGKKYEKIYL